MASVSVRANDAAVNESRTAYAGSVQIGRGSGRVPSGLGEVARDSAG